MGKIDDATKKFVKDTRVFADAFNYYLYKGKNVISPEKLIEQDTNLIEILPNGDSIRRSRDVSMAVNVMECEGKSYMLLAIENQANVHYAMPVRNLLYDTLQYSNQVQKTIEINRANRNFGSSDEFLSGFKKTDKISPVITLVIYFGADEWDGPRSLSEMFCAGSEEYQEFLPQYNLNLISPKEIPDQDFNLFGSSLKEVLLFIKYSKDKDKLSKILRENSEFEKLEYKAAEVIKNCTGLNIKYGEESEEVDMCKAVEDMKQESYEEGMERGIECGIELGLSQGIHQSLVDNIKKIMKSLNYSATQAMDLLEVPIGDRDRMIKEL